MGAVCVSIMIWSVTIYPNKLYKTVDVSMIRSKSADSPTDIIESSNDTTYPREEWVNCIRKDIEILHSFMRFLVRSLCVENMLFMIEVMQFKQEFIHKRKDKDFNHGGIIKLYDDDAEDADNNKIPQSTIVYNNGKYNEHEQIRMIYEKYISDEALLQINVPCEVREKLKEEIILSETFCDNHDDEYLITMLDEVIAEIRLLLIGSFVVFKQESHGLMINDVNNDRSDVNEQIMIAMQDEVRM